MALEMLEIKERHREDNRGRWFRWFEAIRISVAGNEVVAKTPQRWDPNSWDPEFKDRGLSLLELFAIGPGYKKTEYEKASKSYYEQIEVDRRSLVAELLNEGWEPASTNDRGQVVTMKREAQ